MSDETVSIIEVLHTIRETLAVVINNNDLLSQRMDLMQQQSDLLADRLNIQASHLRILTEEILKLKKDKKD